MDEIANLPATASETRASTALTQPDPDSPPAAEGSRFDFALNHGEAMIGRRSPETRRAVQRTLDGLQHPHGPGQAQGSNSKQTGGEHSAPTDLANSAWPAGGRTPVQSARTATRGSPAVPLAGCAGQVSEIVERILVSVPGPAGAEEVRIQLRTPTLDGSEIRLFRDGGRINVVFMPATEAARQFLTGNEARLQAALAERLPDDRVRVEVDATHRSQTASGSNDGRSRQRYLAQDDDTMTR